MFKLTLSYWFIELNAWLREFYWLINMLANAKKRAIGPHNAQTFM